MFFSNFSRSFIILLIASVAVFSQPGNPADLITNGGFNDGEQDVIYKLIHGAQGGSKIVDGQLVCEAKTGGIYDCQIWKMPLNIENGVTYVVSFDAKADAARSFEFSVEKVGGGYTHYADDPATGAKANLTTTMQTFTRTFKMNAPTDNGARLTVSIGGIASTVTFDNFSIIDKTKMTAIQPQFLIPVKSGISQTIEADSRGISFHISNPAHFQFRICSPSGRLVAGSNSVNSGSASRYRIEFPSLGVSSGTYIVQAVDGKERYSKILSVMP
jgi:hypothetical protein